MFVKKDISAFTLVELVVVMGLIAIVFTISLPRIYSSYKEDLEQRKLKSFIAKFESYADKALISDEKLVFELLDDGKGFRVLDENLLLPSSFFLKSLRRAGKNLPETDNFAFYPEGYGDPVFFYLQGFKGKKTLLLHPLQVKLELFEGFIEPEGWEDVSLW